MPFDDLLAANRTYSEAFAETDLTAPADAGVCIVTCMDSRIDPLATFGLGLGDAKVLRNPGGRVTDLTLEGIVLAVNLLGCDRVVVMEHTRCAVASNSEDALRGQLAAALGKPVGDPDVVAQAIPVVDDQQARLEADVDRVRDHPLVPGSVDVGGFIYDVDTGAVERRV